MILVTRRSRNNRALRKYDIGQVVSLKPTGQATILRYGYNGEKHRCFLTGRSEMLLDPEDAQGMVWLAEKFLKRNYQNSNWRFLEKRPKKQDDTWRLIIRYPEGGEEEMNGRLEGFIYYLGLDLTKFLKMILSGQRLMGFGFTPIQAWKLECDSLEELYDLDALTDDEFQYWQELNKKLDRWNKIPEFSYQYEEYKKKYKAYWDNKGWIIR